MAVNTFMCFKISEPRELQLTGIARRWHRLLLRALNSDEETLRLQPIQAAYRLQLTQVPRFYSAEDIKLLEGSRAFQLTSLPRRDDENYIGLTSNDCTIILYNRPESFSNNENRYNL